jgi:hypothetical protein
MGTTFADVYYAEREIRRLERERLRSSSAVQWRQRWAQMAEPRYWRWSLLSLLSQWHCRRRSARACCESPATRLPSAETRRHDSSAA